MEINFSGGIKGDINATRNLIGDIVNHIASIPIGIGNKNYGNLKKMLSYNIGSFTSHKNYFGDARGSMVNIDDDNDNPQAWFYNDKVRKQYSDYLEYVEDNYFNGRQCILDFATQEEKLRFYHPNSQLSENNMVGVVRGYDFLNGYNVLSPLEVNDRLNANRGDSDTRLGLINNFYLYTTLNTAYLEEEKRKKGEVKGISTSAYAYFGKNGCFGLTSDNSFANPKYTVGVTGYEVTPQSLVTFIDSQLTYPKQLGNLNPSGDTLYDISSYQTQTYVTLSKKGYDLLSGKLEIPNIKFNILARNKGDKLYLESIGATQKLITGIDSNYYVRYDFTDVGNDNLSAKILFSYAENNKLTQSNNTYNAGVSHGSYQAYQETELTKKDLIYKTNKLFSDTQKYNMETLVARFHTEGGDTKKPSLISSAVDGTYGMSRGRNLLKKTPSTSTTTNGYDNPYCRVWTFHHQYSTLQDTIRPFLDEDGNTIEWGDNELLRDYRNTDKIFSYSNGNDYLKNLGVKGTNGLVRFSPSITSEEIIGTQKKHVRRVDPKQCMFSIENLAWKGMTMDAKISRGPLGGRIMWFPPYNLKFNENVNVNWNQVDFIGRGEKIYTYSNTDRQGTLSFTLLIDHPSIVSSAKNLTKRNIEEDDLLRFFAGCDILGAEESQETNSNISQQNLSNEESDDSLEVSEIKFSVYFPNDYSGVDDAKNIDIAYPIEYIMHGVGSCQYKENDNVQDIPIDTLRDWYNDDENPHGYEVLANDEIALTSGRTWNDQDIIEYHAMNGNSYIATDYYYRVDNASKDEKLNNMTSYVDANSANLNTFLDEYQENNNVQVYDFESFYYSANPYYAEKFTGDTLQIRYGREIKKRYIPPTSAVTYVECKGWASSQGTQEKNQNLAKNRANTVLTWLKDTCNIGRNGTTSEVNSQTIEATKWSAITETQMATYNGDSNVIDAKKYRKVDVKIQFETQKVPIKQLNKNNLTSGAELAEVIVQAPITEANYFEELEVKDPFLHSKIIEKIKYFDPAFHSINPEGYQSRLTFLHQCTRQGSTSSASDLGSASNLSFGRPPICVLRIGDFYYTKILISSLNIKYDNGSWDLNDEGIGVMPMMADIDINFIFIGGSDLGGPINRLQNAVSFNYYANTSVYESRSENVMYNNDGEISEFKSNEYQ